MTNRTPSAKVNALIEQAESLGLVVEVEHPEGDTVFETYHVVIKRVRVDPDVAESFTALDYYNNSRAIWLNASRYIGDGNTAKAFALSVTSYCGALDSKDASRKVKPTTARYAIDGLAS